jgi:hypothetical protein
MLFKKVIAVWNEKHKKLIHGPTEFRVAGYESSYYAIYLAQGLKGLRCTFETGTFRLGAEIKPT